MQCIEMHLELKDQQLKAILFIYRLLYKNLMITWNQKSVGLAKEFIQIFRQTQMNTLANPIQQIYTQVKKKELRHNTKLSHQITRGLKRKGRKKAYRNKSKQLPKMAIRTCLSLITLNINGLNAPTKRHRLAEWIKSRDLYVCCL